jgi:hypothetical protein
MFLATPKDLSVPELYTSRNIKDGYIDFHDFRSTSIGTSKEYIKGLAECWYGIMKWIVAKQFELTFNEDDFKDFKYDYKEEKGSIPRGIIRMSFKVYNDKLINKLKKDM